MSPQEQDHHHTNLLCRQTPSNTTDVVINRSRSRTDGDVASGTAHADADDDILRPSITSRSHSSPTVRSSSSWSSENPAHAAADHLRLLGQSYAFTESRQPSEQHSNLMYEQEQDMEQTGFMARNKMDSMLPDDDGMHALRQKLHEIHLLSISTEEKAKRMHELMTQGYRSRRPSLVVEAETGAIDHQRPATSEEGAPDRGPLAPPLDPSNIYNLRPEDLHPQISPLSFTALEIHEHHEDGLDDEIPSLLGCMHYKRNVKIQCFDCQRWFPCRHCHDAAHDLPFPHTLNRQKTRNMLCMLCFTPQPAAEICTACGEYAAWYYCSKCKLWDNDSDKRIYHCDDCGICRVGEGLGKDFVHCRRCNVCISVAAAASHPCIEGATEGDCPLCLVRLFESKTPVVSLPCGHYMHGDCYKDLMAVTYKCPVCNKSAVNMELQWRKLDDEIRAQPMPDEENASEGLLPFVERNSTETSDATTAETQNNHSAQSSMLKIRNVWIGCNDCGGRCWTPFHWLGLKCQVCDSYNTIQMAPTAIRETETERILRQQQQHHRQHDLTGDAVLSSADPTAPVRNTVRFLEVPTSPSQVPVPPNNNANARPQSPGSPQSPSGRYFVQAAAPRRPSFTTPRFSAPSLPTIPTFPSLPEGFTRMPRMPSLPTMPTLPNLPNLSNMPNLSNLPNMPNIDFPRFSPYSMFSVMSRSLSPMAYYLQGLETGDAGNGNPQGSPEARPIRPHRMRDRHFSNASICSEPAFSTSTDLGATSAVANSDDDEARISVKSLQKRVRELLLAGNEDGWKSSKNDLAGVRDGRKDSGANGHLPDVDCGIIGHASETEGSDGLFDDDDDDDNDDHDNDLNDDDDDEDGFSTDDWDLMGHR